jgi:hypothetical protein
MGLRSVLIAGVVVATAVVLLVLALPAGTASAKGCQPECTRLAVTRPNSPVPTVVPFCLSSDPCWRAAPAGTFVAGDAFTAHVFWTDDDGRRLAPPSWAGRDGQYSVFFWQSTADSLLMVGAFEFVANPRIQWLEVPIVPHDDEFVGSVRVSEPGYWIAQVRPRGAWPQTPRGTDPIVVHVQVQEKNPDAPVVLTSFMEARLARNGVAALAWVTDALGARSPNRFVGFSNPCFYRYTVESFEQASPTLAIARVRTYTHFWAGDEVGGLPRSSTEEITLINTIAGWRISDLRGLGDVREEPAEPHGPTTSACDLGRRPAVWLASTLPAAGGPPGGLLPGAAALGLMLIGFGRFIRRFADGERGQASISGSDRARPFRANGR